MKKALSCLAFIGLLLYTMRTSAQAVRDDSTRFDYNKIYSAALDGNIREALALVTADSTRKISAINAKLKADLENRFMYFSDRSNYLLEKSSAIDELLHIYHTYWRKSLLVVAGDHDKQFMDSLSSFLGRNYPHAKASFTNEDSIDTYLKKYIQSKGFYTTGFGKTGKLFDLLVWKTQRDTIYSSVIQQEKITARVVMMTGFITLGWEEYATLGRNYPGGWATTDALYCVQQAYDLNSEGFLISYLAHESRHFADYKLFPKLTSADLEYRAKLTELSMAQTTLYRMLQFFINNANYESDNGHSVANYCAIRDLSKKIFNVPFEKDIARWKTISTARINKEAYQILQDNTSAMKLLGPDLEKYIKK